jgi:SET family sugar efflux transporter-like MFS transporter
MVFLTVGLSTAVVMPFLSLFLSTEVHAGPVRVTAFLVVAPLAGVIVSTLVGRLSDRHPIRRPLLIAGALAGAVGTAATAVVRDYWILLALAVTATAIAGTLFPQSFAYAQEVLRGSERATMAISTLRTLFSIAWVAGPPIAAFVLDAGGFVWLYAAASCLYLLAALVCFSWLGEVDDTAVHRTDDPGRTDEPPIADQSRRILWTTTAAFAVLQCAQNLAVQALPLFIRQDLNGSIRASGMILGLCAALEIPLMLGFGALSSRFPLRRMIMLGAVLGVTYYLVVTASTAVWHLAAGQLINAAMIAALAGLGVSYMQGMLPHAPGRAATLFSNAFPIGAIMAGPVLGAAQIFGYRTAYAAAAGLAVIGLTLLLVARPVTPTPARQA